MKKIVFFGSQMTVGGAQRVLLDQADWFRKQGWDVQAVFFYDKDGLLPEWSSRYSFLITALSVALAGACIYLIDKKLLSKAGLTVEQAKKSALRLALITAPYLYFFPSELIYKDWI